MITAWPIEAEIVADGYAITDEAVVLRTQLDGGDQQQRQPHGPGYTVREIDFLMADDADFAIARNRLTASSIFEWTDPEDAITRVARVRGGAAAITYAADVVHGRRAWRGRCEIEGWREPPNHAAAPDFARWPAIALCTADGFSVTTGVAGQRVQMDDGAWRQSRQYSSGQTVRAIAFRLREDDDLLSFRAWSRGAAGGKFAWRDPFSDEVYDASIRGGLGGIRYTADVAGGRREWSGQCVIESSEFPAI